MFKSKKRHAEIDGDDEEDSLLEHDASLVGEDAEDGEGPEPPPIAEKTFTFTGAQMHVHLSSYHS
jgi:hypothetical protein